MITLALILAGGLGAVCRGLMDSYITHHFQGRIFTWPAGIFFVNVVGCFLMGLVAPLLPGAVVPIVTTGFLGGYTTFSTSMVDVVNLALTNRKMAAFALWIGTFLTSFTAWGIGYSVSALLV